MEDYLDILQQKLEAVFELPISFEQQGSRFKIYAKEPTGLFLYGYVDTDAHRWIGRFSRYIELYDKPQVDRGYWNRQIDFQSRFHKFMNRLQHLPVDQRVKLLAERLP